MLTATRRDGALKVDAAEEEKTSGPWACPACVAEVILKKGPRVTHHFAHKPPVSCEYGVGESEFHRRCKRAIYDALRAHELVERCGLEVDIGGARPDIIALFRAIDPYPKQAVAIEVQISALSDAQLSARTSVYAEKKIPVLWLAVHRPTLETKKYRPKNWERWLHAAHYGRVYYWREEDELDLTAVHFDDFMLHREAREWHDSWGEYHESEAYDYPSKVWKVPRPATSKVNLVTGMRGSWERAWKSDNGVIDLPKRVMRTDTLPRWWTPRLWSA